MKYEKWSKEKIASKASLCKTKQEMKKCFPKEYTAAKRMGLLNSNIFSHMPKRIQKGIDSKWSNKEDILNEAAKYPNKTAFFEGSQGCYNAAKRKGWFEEACAQMPDNLCKGCKPLNFKWTKEATAKEALKYNNKSDFRNKSAGAWDAAIKNGWVGEICSHMNVYIRHYSLEELIEIFKSCKNKKEARAKDANAYSAVKRKKVQGIVFSHMPNRMNMSGENSPFYKTNNEEIKQEALKYNNKIAFLVENSSMYQLAYKRGILDEICGHMKNSNGGSSYPERELFAIIKAIYPNARKIRDMKVKIKNKPHIHGFDIDIYIPELNRGIEFDGTYIHSFEGLKRRRQHWPDKDIRNYHKLKDNWFKSKGISVLHIKQKDWKSKKDFCIQKCLDFLAI